MEFFALDRSEWKAERLARSGLDREEAFSQLALGILAAVSGAENPTSLARAIGCDPHTIRRHWANRPRFTEATITGGHSWARIDATGLAAAVAALRAAGGHWIPRLGELLALTVECHSEELTDGPLARTRSIDAGRTLARFGALGLLTATGTTLTVPADHPPVVAVNRARVKATAPVRELVTAGAPVTTAAAVSSDPPMFDGPVEKVWEGYVAARRRFVATHAADPASAGRSVDSLKLGAPQRRLITNALRWTDEDTVLAAVEGWMHSDFHRGEVTGRPLFTLSWLLKDSERIFAMADLTRSQAKPKTVGSPIGNFDPANDGVLYDI